MNVKRTGECRQSHRKTIQPENGFSLHALIRLLEPDDILLLIWAAFITGLIFGGFLFFLMLRLSGKLAFIV